MSNINKVAVLNPFSDLTANILDYVPRATTSKFGIVAIGSGINVDALGRIYLDTQEYSDRLTAIEAQAASSLATQQTEVAAAISQVNLTQSQTITALTLEVDNLKTNFTNRADQLAQNVTDITQQLTQDKAAFTQEIQDALVYLENEASVASALRTPRKIQSVDFDGTQDINLPVFTTELDGLVPKRIGATTTKYLREDGTWVVPPNTTYPLLTQTIAEAGTATTANTISAQVLKAAIQYHTPTVTTITGNAGTATKLQTARTIGSVSFDGTANINLPGVNTAGNQNTSGNAGSASKLATARTLTVGRTGKAFDGSVNIAWTVTEVLPTATPGQFLKFDGTAWIAAADNDTTYSAMSQAEANTGTATSSRVITAGVLKEAIQTHTPTNISGNAGTATKLATARTISLTGVVTGSVNFDGSNNASIDTSVTSAIAIADGGTGGTTAAEARANLGLGTAATREVGTNTGNVMEVGAFGIGGNAIPNSFNGETGGSFLCNASNTNQFLGRYSAGVNIPYRSPDFGFQIGVSDLDDNPSIVYRFKRANSYTAVQKLYGQYNTTIDSNGFIKAASPIVKLFADHIELNDEAQQQNIGFEKLGTGDYLIKGSTGLSQEGWYIEQPKDANGNIYHAVEYGTHANGDIWLKTYEQMMDGTRVTADHTKPIDIKENRFTSIRLNALPEDTSAPINPTIKDNEGNAAPSRLHELVDGVWVISEENAGTLEQERLAVMPALKRRQFRLALVMNGYDLNEIETLINQIEGPMQRTIAQIEWQDATDFERTNPTLLMMAELLQLTSEQIDQLWSYGLAL